MYGNISRFGSPLYQQSASSRLLRITQSFNPQLTRTFSRQSDDAQVLFKKNLGARIITLNRPKAYNALNLKMVQEMKPKLLEWEKSELCKLIILKSDHPKAFCSGGDVKSLIKLAKYNNVDQAAKFFEEEYQLNHMIGILEKPFISIMNGITMGGGVGISIHAPFRIATEKTLFAMPETAIGFFPDVGGSYFLPRLDGKLGYYLGLTGSRLKGEEVFLSGIATHYIPSDRLEELENRLCELETTDLDVIDYLLQDFVGEVNKKTFSLEPYRDIIDDSFSKETMEEIFESLENNGSEFAQQTLSTLKKMSPTSLKITLKALQEGSKLPFMDCFKMEYRVAHQLLSTPDFQEGVTAALETKTIPKWLPDDIQKVDLKHISDNYFNQRFVNNITMLKVNYKEPIDRFGLPTEQDVINSCHKLFDEMEAFAIPLNSILRYWQIVSKGKVGIHEKVTWAVHRHFRIDSEHLVHRE